VRFRIDAGSADERVLVWGPDRELYGATLPVSAPRGLALLGAHVGSTVAAPTLNGEIEHLTLEAVLYQPESARSADPADAGLAQLRRRRSHAGVSSLSAAREWRAAARGQSQQGDDSGPSAA
jgi:regulator of nucleoside diphosphate kinase